MQEREHAVEINGRREPPSHVTASIFCIIGGGITLFSIVGLSPGAAVFGLIFLGVGIYVFRGATRYEVAHDKYHRRRSSIASG